MKNLTKTLLPTLALSFGLFANCFAISGVKIVANDGAEDDYFGGAVSISGDYAIVGADEDDDGGNVSGSAYIYKRNGSSWNQEAKITANDAAAIDRFGESVSISGDYAIVGARFDDDGGSASGSAYIYKRNGSSWNQEAKITANDAAVIDYFGRSVSIDGDYAIVGADNNDDDGSNSGSAYIFKRNGTAWNQEAKITANDAAAGDQFGYSVSISGDYAVVGAYKDDDAGSESGSAYIFKRNGTAWNQEAKITASDGAADDYFGNSVSISENYVIVGAYFDDDVALNTGSGYIFKRTGSVWSQEAKITASDAGISDYFGYSVSINKNFAIVGSRQDDDDGVNSGSAYIFSRIGGTWSQQEKIVSTSPQSNEYFGTSVAIDENNAIVGAIGTDDSGSWTGAAYVFGNFSSGNLVQNGSCEDDLVGGEIPHWTETSGTKWTQRSSNPSPQNGSYYFYAGSQSGTAELQQDVDVSAYSIAIDEGNSIFDWSSYMATKQGIDDAKIILEYRDATNTTVLDTYDSGFYSGQSWQEFTDSRVAPVGTRTIRIRMISDRDLGPQNNGNHDNLFLFTTSTSDADQPLAIELDSFSARQIENSIQLTWITASETENEGFNVYRKTSDSDFIKIASYKSHNELLGQGNSTFETNYTFVDDSELRSGKTYTYYISDVETNGLETKHEENAQTVKFVLGAENVNTKKEYKLAQNFPNPFNPSTTISYQIAKDTKVSLKIYNIKGEFVKELTSSFQQEGSHNVVWNGTDQNGKTVSSGTYFYKLQAGTFTQINKMILLK